MQVQLQTFSHIETMVSKPTWKDILMDLISSNRIDPWNIDILELADAFIARVREMERMDFVVQANVILAASILLKYKSNYLKMLDYQSDLTDFVTGGELLQETDVVSIEELPQLTLSSRIPPKRQITLDELVDEMERVIKYEDIERVRIPRGSIVETVDLELHQHDIERDMELILEKVRENTDSEGWSLFSRVVEGSSLQEVVYTLMCLLHLVQMNNVDIRQDEMFGEIFIYLVEKEK